MKVSARSEKNFRRPKGKPSRRKGLRRESWWRLAKALAVVAVVGYGAYRGVELVRSAPFMRVDQILVRGNVRLSSGEVRTVMRELRGSHILAADLGKYRALLLDSPWVSDAELRRVLPSTVEVEVAERRPFGMSRLGSQLYLIDRDGTVIDEFGPQYLEFDLPIIDGLVRAPRDGKPSIDEARAAFAARVVDSLQGDRELARRVSQIDVSDPHDAVVLLDDDPASLHLGEDQFGERLRSYLEVAATLRARWENIDYVDLRFKHRLFVKPRGEAVRAAGVAPGSRSF